MATKAPEMKAQIIGLDFHNITLKLEGETPLLVHRFSEKNKKIMQDSHIKKASKGKVVYNLQEEYEESFYRLPDGRPGFPFLAFKSAAVSGCTSLGKQNMPKTLARQAFHIHTHPEGGDLYPIEFPEDCPPAMRQDPVKPKFGCAIRARPEFKKWGVCLSIQFNAGAISLDQLVNLVNTGGLTVGVGDWRPEKNGIHGRFRVVKNFSWEGKD